jgi:hypothetical protein
MKSVDTLASDALRLIERATRRSIPTRNIAKRGEGFLRPSVSTDGSLGEVRRFAYMGSNTLSWCPPTVCDFGDLATDGGQRQTQTGFRKTSALDRREQHGHGVQTIQSLAFQNSRGLFPNI